MRKSILLDLDGVLNEYKGKYNPSLIPNIRKGAKQFLQELSLKYKVIIFTTRNKRLVSEWVNKNNLSSYIEDITNIKYPAYLIIDDRCIQYKGDYNQTISEINNFEVWYKKNNVADISN